MNVKNAKNGSTRSVVMCQKYFSPSPKICSGHAWTATESTCAVLYCVNRLKCVHSYKLFIFLCMHVYLQHLLCTYVCCLLVAAEFFIVQ